MSDFRFAHPNWSFALWLVVAVVALLFWLDWRRSDVLSRFVSAAMQSRLVQRVSRTRRWSSIGCLGLAGVSLVLALMRPQWGLTYVETPRVGAQIMVCLDVSKSMLAEDTAPNRLERAKAELNDLLSFLDGDQVGLIAFAGRATVLCPLTPDFGFFKLILDGAGPDSVGRGGTRLEEPIRKALDGFRTESDVSRTLLLITDGEDQDSHPLDAAKAAAERGVKILAIGFGDEAGSEIYVTDPQTGARRQVRGADGQPVITRLDGQTLRDMALLTEGAYIPAGTGALDLKSIYDAHIAPLVRGQLNERGRPVRREAFQWAVLAGLLLLLASVVIGSGSVRSELQAAIPSRAATPIAGGLGDAARTPKSGADGYAARQRALRAGLLCLAAALATHSARAQSSPPADDTPPVVLPDKVKPSAAGGEPATRAAAEPEPQDPREVYNDALAYLASDLDRAERLLTAARREAATDGDVRFRATYNLGWVQVNRANQLIADKPQEALACLRRAADWFRDAVRLRPDHTDARHNLEVIQRRVLELADSLASHDKGQLDQQLDELIQSQRGLVGTARQLVDRVSAQSDPNAADRFRGDFRQLAVQQRELLSDSQTLSGTAREELDALSGKREEERSPEDRVRVAQLASLLHYMNGAEQRLGQARSQMRRRQAERSFRRAAAGLTELKRARDQLRGPVEVLDVILADAAALVEMTSLKAMLEAGRLDPRDQALGVPTQENPQAADHAPQSDAAANGATQLRWLTREYLDEDQQSVAQRAAELTARLQAAEQQPAATPAGSNAAGSPATGQQPVDAAQDRFLAMVREAMPFLRKSQQHFQAAAQSLAADQFSEAAARQLEAVAALRAARERFVDLRGLIELAYARQNQVQQLLSPPAPPGDAAMQSNNAASDASPASGQPSSADDASARVPIAVELQSENLDRGQRMADMIEANLAELPPDTRGQNDSTKNSQATDPAQQQAAAQRQPLELAKQLLDSAREEMTAVAAVLREPSAEIVPSDQPAASAPSDATDKSAPESPTTPRLDEAQQHAARAVQHLQELRRLFFSIIEHLRETAQRQAELNDDTERIAALAQSDDSDAKIPPLAVRQRELQSIAQQIAQALEQQGQQPPPAAASQDTDPKQLEQLQQIAERFVTAARLVSEGGQQMEQAAGQLATPAPSSPASPALDQARQHQDTALQKLVEALTLLQPPPPQEQNQDQDENQDQDQQSQNQDEQSKDQQQDPQQQTAGLDPSRALQAVRDREAQRRRDRERRQRLQQEPVERDW